MKSNTAKNYIDNNAVMMHNGDRMVDASTAYMAVEIAEQEAEERIREELTRWRNPKEELPPPRQVALLKLKDGDGEVYYRVGIFLDCRQFQFIGYRLGSEVLGWRPINE